MMEDIEKTTYDYSPLVVGNAQYESAGVAVNASTSLKKGSVVIRSNNGWDTATGETLVAGKAAGILVEDLENNTESSKTLYTRILIAGDVVMDKVFVETAKITLAQADILRANSIICTKRTEMARV